ncbi:MAG: transglycosylase SLT domain-containing protein [Spirochaetaceae bacterium]|nr:transglycosylase SLT domain-containing protein [Spirochaetaceae bacterium]
MTILQQKISVLLVLSGVFLTPLVAQEVSTTETSSATPSSQEESQAEVENETQVSTLEEEPQGEVPASNPETPALDDQTTEDEGQEEDQRPPRKELDIHTPEHIHIQKYLDDYQKPFGIRWLTSVLEAGAPYRMYARQQLALNNMPASLEYLPVVESEYKVTAKSRSGALGIWQFMENSIYPFLEKNQWVDERLDPWKSTDAAIKKLQDNYNMFGDWALALAAYNYGAGGLKRVIKASGGVDNFWDLADQERLSNQTILYVPKFLAVAEIVTNQEYYGLEFPDVTEADLIQWDEVTTKRSVPLQMLAKELNIDVSILKFLNPALILGRTPPAMEYTMRVPLGTKEEVEKAISNMVLPTYEHTYKVVQGDTLWGISRRYGLTVADICDANNIEENAILPIGKTLYIPIIE